MSIINSWKSLKDGEYPDIYKTIVVTDGKNIAAAQLTGEGVWFSWPYLKEITHWAHISMPDMFHLDICKKLEHTHDLNEEGNEMEAGCRCEFLCFSGDYECAKGCLYEDNK